jgi:LysR family glycine cleavage system transcriptional activator
MGAENGALVISCGARFANRWLAPKLPRLLASPAGRDLDIRVEDRAADFTTDGVDMAIRFGTGDWDGVEVERVLTEHLRVVCSPAFAARHGVTKASDLLAAPLIHNRDIPWSLLFDVLGFPAPAACGLEIREPLMVLETVEQGEGAALVRASLVEEDLRSGRLVDPIGMPIALPRDYGYFVVWRADSRKRSRIQALRDWLRAEVSAAEPVGA